MEDWETKQTHEQQTKQLHIHQQHSHWKAQSRRPWATRDASISSFSTESDGSCSGRVRPQLYKAEGGSIRAPFSGGGRPRRLLSTCWLVSRKLTVERHQLPSLPQRKRTHKLHFKRNKSKKNPAF